MGNIHFEGFMILFLLIGIWALLKKKSEISAVAMALSVSSKLLPLMFFPLITTLLSCRKAIIYLIISGLSLFVLFTPFFINTQVFKLFASLELYVNKFEYNGGIYYFLRDIGYAIKGFNTIHIIGPILSISTVIIILLQALYLYRKKIKSQSLIVYMLFAFTTYLLLATTVHPWYISTILALCTFTRYRYPLVWSGLIFFTYINYSNAQFYENLWIVFIEYSIVFGFMIYEFGIWNIAGGLIKTETK